MSRRITRRNFIETLAAMGLVLPEFDVKHPRGLDFKHVNSPTPKKYLIETMGGGVALFDYNNDGLLDLFVSNYGNNTVTEYAPPYTAAPVATMSSSPPSLDSNLIRTPGSKPGWTAGRSTLRRSPKPRSSALGPMSSTCFTCTASIRTCRSKMWPER